MVDFKKLVSKPQDVNTSDLIALFESLDRQTSHIELRNVQQNTLEIMSGRRKEKDLILKISTGSGKTTLGLLYLWSFMEEMKRPVVYLCPTTQLCKQVLNEAYKLGIKAVQYPRGKSHPDIDGIGAKAVIVCTYDKLFNAKTTFDRSDVMLRPCAMVLDDAHAGVEEIRGCFTLQSSEDDLYSELLDIFAESCQRYKSSVWEGIKNGDPSQLLEVPYWLLRPLLPDIEKMISKYISDKKYMFVTPNILGLLRWCRCVISGKSIEIIPDILPVHKNAAFTEASHRLFMSATLADDSVLVRELGCDFSSASNPIIPDNDRGMGERMVLAPSLIDSSLNREWIMSQCAGLAKKMNVVVLSPSEVKAREWELVGAEVYMGDDVNQVVNDLNNPFGNPKLVVFPQRYDGIDLPDYSCRILVLDGMPLGEGVIDKYDSSMNGVAGGTRNKLIYRIEQGMGRCVRSHADYAVILLSGHELAHFIAKHDVLSSMNPDTQAQLKLAVDLSRLATEDVGTEPAQATFDMIFKCLNRDEGWKQFYNETVRLNPRNVSGHTTKERISLANAEREAYELVRINDFSGAIKHLRSAIDINIQDNPFLKGWYLQRVANYMFELDEGDALEIQRAACQNNKSMFLPPGIVKRPTKIKATSTQSIISDWIKQFDNPNGTIAYIQSLKARLSYNVSHSTLEQALCDLAPLLGAQGSRPDNEFDDGPDDLWLWDDMSLVIEAKNENKESLHKKDAGQLLVSLEWFKKHFQERKAPLPITVAKITVSDDDAYYPTGTRVITPNKMTSLLDRVEKFYRTLVESPLLGTTPQSLAKLQQKFSLLPEQFIGNYTEKIT